MPCRGESPCSLESYGIRADHLSSFHKGYTDMPALRIDKKAFSYIPSYKHKRSATLPAHPIDELEDLAQTLTSGEGTWLTTQNYKRSNDRGL